jgi:tRNA-dihydrouridine synthase A
MLAPDALLYTEMVTTGAVLHGDRDRLIGFSEEEHPLALQLGGSEPVELAECARIAQQRAYDEVNLNVGCPSDRVQRGRFGACLMLEPERVRDCVHAMREAVDIPVTVKTRLGVDDCDNYDYFRAFVEKVAHSGCEIFIVHARKAWLTGLSPKENRDVPELRYEWVARLKKERPDLTVILNGGITSASDAQAHLATFDGVMLGRAAYHTPWLLAELQQAWFDRRGVGDREDVIERMTRYIGKQVDLGVPVKNISRHLLGLYQGLPGAKRWRRFISENAHLDNRNDQLLLQALQHMRAGRPEPPGSAMVHGNQLK